MSERPAIAGRRAVITSGHYLATAAGARMFARGGNAVDAGVAAGFALAVLKPHQNGLGGECPILIHDPRRGEVVAVSGQGTAPRKAAIEWFRGHGIDVIPGDGYLPATVPAAVGAYCAVLRTYGRLTLYEVIQPALELAADGFPVYEALHRAIADHAERFRRDYPSTAAIFLPGGEVPALGRILRQEALARTLARLAEAEEAARDLGREGAIRRAEDLFYRGEIARQIVEFSANNPVPDATGEAHAPLLTVDDFAAYATLFEPPVQADYRRWRVYKCGPWTQGPVFLQQLKLLEGFDLAKMGHNSAAYVHHVVEAAKLAFADRERFYGDPDFAAVPLARLLSDDYNHERRGSIDPRRANNDPMWEDAEPGGGSAPVPGDTTHLDAADADGLMISATPSGGWIPTSPVIPELGFALGTRGQMFKLRPGHPNALAPGKRPRTTLTPSLAFSDGGASLAFGTPGGDNQDQWTLQFFLNLVEFGMGLQEAVDAPSFHTGHFPSSFYPHEIQHGTVYAEEGIEGKDLDRLREMGHLVKLLPPRSNGEVCAVRLESGIIEGAASPKEEGNAYTIGW